MLKYVETAVVFGEIPDEITLAINISGCPIKCPDCHSKHLWEDIGEPLDRDSLNRLIEENKGITCVAFMGGDGDILSLQKLFYWVKTRFPNLRVAWYSGADWLTIKKSDVTNLDYMKTGPYIKEKGGLTSKTTNQKLYKIEHYDNGGGKIEDITNKFWRC